MTDCESMKMVSTVSEQKEEIEEKNVLKIATGYKIADSTQQTIQQAKAKFAKPNSYTGNRKLYDSGKAKKEAKLDLFRDGNEVIDPYTGNRLVLTKKEAKMLYGDEWGKHLAESDHIKPLERVFEDTQGNVWNTIDDIKDAANSKDNICVTSHTYNNPKRERLQKEYVENEEYRKKKGVNLTEEGKIQAIKDGEIAETSINRQLRKKAAKNVLETGHRAGTSTAYNAGMTAVTMSGVMNIMAVVKGDKEVGEAIADTVQDGGKAAASGYVLGNALTIVGNSLSNSSSQILQSFIKSNIPGKVITAVQITGNTLKKYGNGEITIEECIEEIGKNGVNLATIGYFSTVGQTLIPIPIVGAAIGALIGSVVTSTYYDALVASLNSEYEHQQRLRIIEESKQIAQEARQYRADLEKYLDDYFKEYKKCFDEALLDIGISFQINDAEGVVEGANQITRKLGGKVYYDSIDEFKSFLSNGSVDIF